MGFQWATCMLHLARCFPLLRDLPQPPYRMWPPLLWLLFVPWGQQNMPPQHRPLCWLFCVVGTWKTANAGRGFLCALRICLKMVPPQRKSVVTDLFPRRVVSQGRLTHHIGEEATSRHLSRQTLSQTVTTLIYSSKFLFIFPESHLLSPKGPASSLPFPYWDGI